MRGPMHEQDAHEEAYQIGNEIISPRPYGTGCASLTHNVAKASSTLASQSQLELHFVVRQKPHLACGSTLK